MKSAALFSVVALALSAIVATAACPAKDTPSPETKNTSTAAHEPAHGGKTGSYTCPMHPEVVADAPGKCPKCKMALVSTAPQAPIDVTVSTTPAKPKAGEKTKLVFEMKSQGARLEKFDVVHEKKLHLLMITPDLAWFAHEHPEPLADGTFVLEYAFPSGGTYRLFSDFKATDRPGAVLTTDIVVDGPPAPAKPLVPSDLTQARAVDEYEVRMTSPVPVSGVDKQLTFVVTKDKKPVLELEPYLGAMGHLVVIGSDGKTFLHAHPEEHDDVGDAAKPHDHAEGTPVHGHSATPGIVSFTTRFPAPGLYKAWAQFQVKGKPVIADFVLDVAPGAPGAPGAAPGAHGGEHHH